MWHFGNKDINIQTDRQHQSTFYVPDWNGKQVKCYEKIESFMSDTLNILNLIAKKFCIDDIYFVFNKWYIICIVVCFCSVICNINDLLSFLQEK